MIKQNKKKPAKSSLKFLKTS